MASCSVPVILAASQGFMNLSPVQLLAVQVQLLCDIAGAQVGTCDMASLVNSSTRFCCLSSGQHEAVQSQLLCELGGQSGNSCDINTLLEAANRFLGLEPGQLIIIKAQLLCQIMGGFQNQCSAPTLLNTLLAHWKLNKASGQRNDSSGRGNHLSDNNTVGQAEGKINQAALFIRANSEFLSIPSNMDLTFNADNFTISAWVYLTTKANTMALVAKDDGSNKEYSLIYNQASDRFVFQVATEIVAANTFGSPATGTWYHVLCYEDVTGEVIGIRVNNGATDEFGTGGVFAQSGTAQFRLGARDSGAPIYLDGRVDSVSVWERLLTADESTALYCNGLGLDYSFS